MEHEFWNNIEKNLFRFKMAAKTYFDIAHLS